MVIYELLFLESEKNSSFVLYSMHRDGPTNNNRLNSPNITLNHGYILNEKFHKRRLINGPLR